MLPRKLTGMVPDRCNSSAFVPSGKAAKSSEAHVRKLWVCGILVAYCGRRFEARGKDIV